MSRRLFPLLCIATAALAGGLPHAGKWKVNLAKSDFGQIVMTIESLPADEWQATSFGVTYKFKMDGKEYPDNLGGTVAWKAIDSHTWELTAKANGKITETDTYKLAADGKTMTATVKQMKADGGSLDSTALYERTSGGTSLPGKWKTKKISGASGTVEMIASGTDGMTFKSPDMGMTCEAKVDGKDYPCTGPMLPQGFTIALMTAGPSLDFTVKKDGKAYFHSTFRVSGDGKEMTETGTSINGGDKFKIVYDRI